MKLLVVTDHRYHASAAPAPGGVFHDVHDTYCFDRRFFDDYRAVFDQVRVAARLRHGPVPAGASRSDGDGVEFIGLRDVQGTRWVAAPTRCYMAALPAAVAWADAVCVRIPSIAGVHAFRLARRRRKPVMFELLGDPAIAMAGQGMAARAVGLALARATRYITSRAAAGSYVSRGHLQARYPSRRGAPTASISSIRLRAGDIRSPRRFAGATMDPFEVALTASLVPVKDHATLIRAVAHAAALGAPARLHLLGDGPQRGALTALAAELGMAARVIFHGHVAERSRIDDLLDRAHLFAMTSVSEGMPRAMIEAMARGVPCVGTRAGGIAELLGPSELVAVGDHRALGALIASLASDPARLERLAEHSVATARAFVDTELSARRVQLLGALAEACRSLRG